MKTIPVPLTPSEISYLLILLDEAKEKGDYWGNKTHHYKRRDTLLEKLERIDSEIEHGHN